MMPTQQEQLDTSKAQQKTGKSRYYPDSPDALLRKVVDSMPGATDTELEEEFEIKLLGHGGAVLSMVVSYWFERRYRALLREREPAAVKRRRRAMAEQLLAHRVAAVKEAAVTSIARTLLDKIAPGCGKTIGDMTGEDCRREGGWYMRLADRVPPRQTVSQAKLTDEELWRLYSA